LEVLMTLSLKVWLEKLDLTESWLQECLF
jgi:hypothetical protein